MSSAHRRGSPLTVAAFTTPARHIASNHRAGTNPLQSLRGVRRRTNIPIQKQRGCRGAGGSYVETAAFGPVLFISQERTGRCAFKGTDRLKIGMVYTCGVPNAYGFCGTQKEPVLFCPKKENENRCCRASQNLQRNTKSIRLKSF